MNFYTVGDSHSGIFSKSKHFTKQFWLGGVTMNRIGRDHLNFKSIDVCPIEPVHYSIPNDGVLLVTFGEIDVRNHIHKQVELGRDINEICNTLVMNYIRCIIMNRDLNGYKNIAILAVNPPRRGDDPSIEMKGTDDQRKSYQVILNIYLSFYCKEHSLYLLDLTSYYSDSDGFLDATKRDSTVHLLFSDYMEESIEKMLEYFRVK
jgi:hypothetical protein